MRTRIIYWILVMAFQILVLNHLDFSAYVIPQVFIIVLITMSLGWSKIQQLGVGFGLGLVADLFIGTPGMHASACLWLVLLRMGILGTQDIKQQAASNLTYNAHTVGFTPFMSTAVILVLFYHLYVFWLQNIGALHFTNYLLTVVISSLLALTIIGILEYLSFQRK